ncbi:MAG: hypothetical protein AABX37_00650 [Nanoarchaeota archaeon]
MTKKNYLDLLEEQAKIADEKQSRKIAPKRKATRVVEKTSGSAWKIADSDEDVSDYEEKVRCNAREPRVRKKSSSCSSTDPCRNDESIAFMLSTGVQLQLE